MEEDGKMPKDREPEEEKDNDRSSEDGYKADPITHAYNPPEPPKTQEERYHFELLLPGVNPGVVATGDDGDEEEMEDQESEFAFEIDNVEETEEEHETPPPPPPGTQTGDKGGRVPHHLFA